MKKVIGFLSNSKAIGMDAVEAFLFPDNVSDERIGEEVWYAAIDNAASFFNVVEEYDEDNEDEPGYISLAEIDSYWEIYNGEDHDGLLTSLRSYHSLKEFRRFEDFTSRQEQVLMLRRRKHFEEKKNKNY